jgi:hypothetical protein
MMRVVQLASKGVHSGEHIAKARAISIYLDALSGISVAQTRSCALCPELLRTFAYLPLGYRSWKRRPPRKKNQHTRKR